MATNNGKFAPEHKNPGDLILSAEWNAGMQETVRLESAKVNRQGGDSLQGPLTIESALAFSTDTLRVELEVKGALKLAKGVAVNEFSNDDSLSADSDRIVPTQKAVKAHVHEVATYLYAQLKEESASIVTAIEDGRQGNDSQDFKAQNLSVKGSLKFSKGVPINEFSTDGKLGSQSDSDEVVSTQKAVKAYVDLAVQSVVVKGMILMWSGQVNQIPTGWALCNGQNGTPDLRDRFIVGAYEAGSRPTPQSGDYGEADQHNHSMASRSLSTSIDGQHLHVWMLANFPNVDHWSNAKQFTEIKGTWGIKTIYHKNNLAGGMMGSGTLSHVTTDDGNHSHTVNFDGLTTGNSIGNNRPKWYALCFIMKQ